jgi:hypothetical protein
MPPIPSVTEEVLDGGLSQVEPSALTPIFFGKSSLGTTNELKFYNQDTALKTARGDGPVVEAALHALTQGGGPVGVISCDATIAASNGAPQRVGSTGPAVTYTGTANLDARFRIKITSGGVRGKAKFVYTCDDFLGALDSERTYSEELAVPSGGTFAVPNLGITATFAVQTLSAVVKSGAGPTVTVTGTPADSYNLIITITTGGALATAVFKWSIDGGITETTAVTTAATVALGATGLTANFPAGTYVLNETYTASTVGYVAGEEYYVDVQCAAWNASDLAECFAALAGSVPWRFVVPITSKANGDATAHALLVVALQAQLNTLANSSKYRRGMIAGEHAGVPASAAANLTNAANVITAQASVSAKRCLVAYGSVRRASAKPFSGFAYPVTHAVDCFAARAVGSLVSTDLKRVKSGALAGVSKIFHDEYTAPTGLDTAKISTLRTWEGRSGFYPTQARLKSDAGSDFKLWPHGILMDIACETAHEAHIEFVGRGFRLTNTGTMDDRDASPWEQEVAVKLLARLMGERNAEGFSGHVSQVFYQIDRTNNVSSSGIILYTVGIRPLGYADFIKGQLGFAVALPAIAA